MAITKLPRSGIADNSINASKIEDGTVAAAEISGTVSAAKLNATLDISGKTVTLPNTSVTSGQLAGSIANAKLANSAITVRGVSRALGTSFSIGVDVDWQSKVTSDGSTVTTMVANQGYFVDNSSAAGIVKLPTSASIGDTIAIKDYAGNFGTNVLVIQRNGHKIQGETNDSKIETNRANVVLVYVDATKGWLYTDEHNVADLRKPLHTEATGGTVTTSGDYKIHSFTGDGNFVVSQIGNAPVSGGGPNTVSYMVVAGGGGNIGPGHYNGGGGAGGFREGRDIGPSYTASPLVAPAGLTIAAQTYPVTVGAGGGANGSNSIFSTITSTGGGGGGRPGTAQGNTGGSGGGGAPFGPNAQQVGGAGNTPPVSPPQGNTGGTGENSSPPGKAAGGGGGGATAVGGNSNTSNPITAGSGGAGATTHITGSPVAYAGGGGGAAYLSPSGGGTGGAGGGGNGGNYPNNPASTNGSANTGGGGGGDAGFTNPTGGKGIVVIRYKFQ